MKYAESADVVPGAGRMDERDLVARGVFGALYRRPDGKVAGVGTAMRVAAHDVIIDGKLLSVYGEGDFRFKVLRVRQANPYLVVDAVPLTDAGAPAASGPKAAESDPARIDSRAVANNVVRFVLGYVRTLVVDMCFLVEAKTEEELPERLIGTSRVAHLEPDAAVPPPPRE